MLPRVALFIPCFVDQVCPQVGVDMTRVLRRIGCEVDFRQSNLEGEIVTWIQTAGDYYDAVILNPGAFAHYSYAIRDAVTAGSVRLFEVHISNIYAREDFRRISVIAPVAAGMITGLGTLGYQLALEAAVCG